MLQLPQFEAMHTPRSRSEALSPSSCLVLADYLVPIKTLPQAMTRCERRYKSS